MPRKAPYIHSDGSPCWTVDCSRGHAGSQEPKFQVPSFYKPEAFPVSKAPTPGAWTDADTVLFRTPHGSTLYGLSHANSDQDWYVVNPSPYVARKYRASQKISDNQDVVAVPFKKFIESAMLGVPQSLETMFSRQATSPFFEDFRQNYYASDPTVIHTYMRTIKSFSLSENDKISDKDKFKRKRHALRLATNLEELLYRGRFNPTLNSVIAEKISRLAEKHGDEFMAELKAVSPIEIDWTYESEAAAKALEADTISNFSKD